MSSCRGGAARARRCSALVDAEGNRGALRRKLDLDVAQLSVGTKTVRFVVMRCKRKKLRYHSSNMPCQQTSHTEGSAEENNTHVPDNSNSSVQPQRFLKTKNMQRSMCHVQHAYCILAPQIRAIKKSPNLLLNLK